MLGITDHDTTEGLSAALAEAQRWNIRLVPGVEISTVSGREEIHLLGYFVNVADPDLQALLARAREARWERAQAMLKRLANLGLSVEWERVLEIAGQDSAIGRPHVALSLLEAGHVSTYNEAFDLWIGRGCPAYIERYKLSPEEAIHLVRKGGGLPVLAHPYFYDRNGGRKAGLELGRWLPRLREAGLAGIEIYYPNYPRRVSRQLLVQASQYGLLITGGSDFHGSIVGNGLGSVAVPWAAWEALDRRQRLIHQRSPRRTQTEPTASLAPSQGFV